MTMKRYEALRDKVNSLFEFYIENNIQYKYLTESGIVAKMSQISNEELNEMSIVHAMEEPEAAAEVTSEQCNVRRPVVFDKASNVDEELLILFTSNEAIEPVATLKMASARILDVQQLGDFQNRLTAVQIVLFCDPNLFAKIFAHLFPF